MATIKDVARQAGVSVSTVSRVLTGNAKVAENKKQAVHDAMAVLDYRPNTFARALVNRRANSIGLVVGDLAEPFFGALMGSIEQVLSEADQQIIIACGHQQAEQERRAIEFLRQRNCDAIIVHAKALSDDTLIELAASGPPMVIINHYIEQLADRCIYLDNQRGGELATEHLLEHGHQRIACLTSSLPIEDSRQRLSGYRQALDTANVAFESQLVVETEPTLHGGSLAIERLLDDGVEFSAVFAYNDVMAAGAIQALEQRGVAVPAQVSVVGFDDIAFASFIKPRLTTIRYPIQEMGRVAAHMALQKVDQLTGQAMSKSREKVRAAGEHGEDSGESQSPLTTYFVPAVIERESVSKR